jgi:peroxiredoxin
MSRDTPEDRQQEESKPPPAGWRRALVWLERVVTAGIVVFLAIRLGPQLGALTGVGPSLGSAPAYSLVTLGGDTVRSADLAGKVVVLNFWATWCAPCRLEMPSLQALHERSDTSRVAVIGLSTDVGSPDGIRAFLEERDITYPVGRATPEHRQAFGGIGGIPTTFIIDPRGVIQHRVVGYFTPPALSLAVGRLVDEPAEKPSP